MNIKPVIAKNALDQEVFVVEDVETGDLYRLIPLSKYYTNHSETEQTYNLLKRLKEENEH